MKPVHIVILVLAGALVGAVTMKVVQRPRPVAANLETASVAATVPAAAQVQPEFQPQPSTTVQTPSQPEIQAQVPQAAAVTPAETPASPHEVRVKRSVVPPSLPQRPARRHAPPPANPRPLVVAKLEPPQPMTANRAETTPQQATVPQQPALQPPAPVVQESPMPQAPSAAPPVENATPPAPPQPVPHTVTLNTGLLLPVRLVDGLSSERNAPGDTFLATLDHELVVDGFVIAERGARVEGRVVAADRGNKTLSVELTRLHTSDRQVVAIETDAFEKHIAGDHRQDAEKVGAGAAIGAVIGALAGGGKGAAIGAGVGGGAGAGDVMLTRKPATLPSETRISFRLRTPVRLTERLE